MKSYPTNPYFYWDTARESVSAPVRVRRVSYSRRARGLVADIQDRYARSRTGGVRGFDNLHNMFEMFNRLNRMSIRKHNNPIPVMHTNLFKMLVSSALPRMFGDDYDFYKKSLMSDFGIDTQRLKTAASMPRRFGKSTCAGWFVGSYAWSQWHEDKIEIVVVSMNRDVSKLLTELIVNTIVDLSEGAVAFDVKNDSRIEFVNSVGCHVMIHCKICTNVSFFILNGWLYKFAFIFYIVRALNKSAASTTS